MFTHCLQSPNKLQINAISFEQLTEILDTKDDMPLDDKKYLQKHFEQNLLSEQEIITSFVIECLIVKNYLTIGKNPILNIYL